MKKILLIASVGLSSIAFSQVNLGIQPNISIANESVFLDATQYVTFPNNVGKGLVFPKVDLTTFTFVTPSTTPSKFRTAYDGMVVYNSGTGSVSASASTGQATTVSPGFYYFYNPTGATTRNVTAGVWKPFSPTAANGGGNEFWTVNGNGGTTPVTLDTNNKITAGNFIGTTDASNLTLATNKVAKLVIGDQTGVTVDAASFNFVLDVLGKARFRNGIVTEKSTYPDYVFEKYFTGASKINPNYQFKSLAETEKFVKENNHLPGVTKITEFSKDGQKYLIDAAELSVQNLEKVEELYLHTIQQQKEIDALKAEIAEIKASLKK